LEFSELLPNIFNPLLIESSDAESMAMKGHLQKYVPNIAQDILTVKNYLSMSLI
jgi:hypothetical protein